MPTYLHLCQACQHEFEDMYSMSADPPTVCPSCKVEGQVRRLIYGGSGKGKVKLSGGELREHMEKEAADFKKEIMSNENALANFIGEGKYQQNLVREEKTYARDSGGRPLIRFRR